MATNDDAWRVAAATSHFSTTVLPKGFEPVMIDGWVQVSDRLPPDGEYVLWWNPKDGYLKYRLAARDGNGLDWGGDLLEPIAAFTHWRPLPGPPTAIVK